MQCPRCLNTDKEFFYKGKRGWYCRKCISFGRTMLEEERNPVSLRGVSEGSEEYTLAYPLTKAQAEIAFRCAEEIRHRDVLLHCVCGAGKTELAVLSIAGMLKEKKKVCFAIPRRQVVLELRERLQQYFPKAKVIAVCGGHTEETDGDLIICTTHQLYRYYQAFDLLILDEPDAFPFHGNDILYGIAKTACRGHFIFLTATPDETLRKRAEERSLVVLKLFQRPHGVKLPEPSVVIGPYFLLVISLLRWIKKHAAHPRMVFVPSVSLAKRLGKCMNAFVPCMVCTAESEDKDQVMETFRKMTNGLVICTSVLERGITVPRVDIAVLHAEASVFDEASLTQIAGRAGRTFSCPYGDVLFLCTEKSETVQRCRTMIREANTYAMPVVR